MCTVGLYSVHTHRLMCTVGLYSVHTQQTDVYSGFIRIVYKCSPHVIVTLVTAVHCRVLPERTIWRLNRFLGFDTIMKSFEGHLKKD